MQRRSFLKSIGLLVGSVALASQGIYLKAKEKAIEWGWIKAGEVFTIEGILGTNGKPQPFRVISRTETTLTIRKT